MNNQIKWLARYFIKLAKQKIGFEKMSLLGGYSLAIGERQALVEIPRVNINVNNGRINWKRDNLNRFTAQPED